MKALAGGAYFDETALSAVHPGVSAFEAGCYCEAALVLAAAVERVVRNVAVLSGVEVHRFKPDTAEIQWASLNTMLDEPAVTAKLGAVRPDFGRQIGYLLAESEPAQ